MNPERPVPQPCRTATPTITDRTPTRRHAMCLVGQLPLLPAAVLWRVAGLAGPAGAYRALARLREDGLAAAVKAPADTGGARHLCARRGHPGGAGRGRGLGRSSAATADARRLGILPQRLPAQLALYDLVPGLVASGPGCPEL
jgi:hypothetical protein